MNRNLTCPYVSEQLESDLAPDFLNRVTVRYKDASGKERELTNARLKYVPYVVGDDEARSVSVPLSSVTTIELDRVKRFERRGPWPDFATESVSELHLVASWRRAPWDQGELVRSRPE